VEPMALILAVVRRPDYPSDSKHDFERYTRRTHQWHDESFSRSSMRPKKLFEAEKPGVSV
jgi:hypothetical protein